MFLIVWSGKGVCVPLVFLAALLLTIGTNLVWPAFAVAAAVVFLLDRFWVAPSAAKRTRVLTDTNGHQLVLKPKDALFWIPFGVWTYILLGFAVLTLGVRV